MALSRCQVSYIDAEGITHAVMVGAESVYEAVALAVAEFRKDTVSPSAPDPQTELIVTVLRNPVEHRIRLAQVKKWAEYTTREGPAGIMRRERVRALLAPSVSPPTNGRSRRI